MDSFNTRVLLIFWVLSFFGFDIEDVSDVKLSIEISNTDKVKNIAIQYKAENGNDVSVSIKVGYTQVIKFSLPTVE